MSLTASEIHALADRQWCVLPGTVKASITLPAKRQKAHSPSCANSNVSRNKPPHLLNS